jgi:hypothetical protein
VFAVKVMLAIMQLKDYTAIQSDTAEDVLCPYTDRCH